MLKWSLWKAPLSEGTDSRSALLVYLLPPKHEQVTPPAAVYGANVWPCSVVLLTGLPKCLGHTTGELRKRESQGACCPPAIYPHQNPPTHPEKKKKDGGEATSGPEAIKVLMAFDSNFFMSPRPAGAASGEIGCLFCPLKHTDCAHKSRSMVSLCSGSVFVHTWVRSVWNQAWWAEAGRIVRGPGCWSQKVWTLLHSCFISSGESPAHQENIFGKPWADIPPDHKGCLCASQPRGVEITRQGFRWGRGGFSSSHGLQTNTGHRLLWRICCSCNEHNINRLQSHLPKANLDFLKLY